MFQNCTTPRTKLVKTYARLGDAADGVAPIKQEWVEEPCGIPLFNPAAMASGVCSSCQRGWEHPDNYTTTKGRPKQVIDPQLA